VNGWSEDGSDEPMAVVVVVEFSVQLNEGEELLLGQKSVLCLSWALVR
jgi:hypothetical protein